MSQTPTANAPVGRTVDTVIAWLAVAAFPVVVALGFWVGYGLVGDPNEPGAPHGWDGVWRVVVLWAVVEIIPVVGIVFGRRAVRRREPAGRAAVVANALVFLLLAVLTLAGGLGDVL